MLANVVKQLPRIIFYLEGVIYLLGELRRKNALPCGMRYDMERAAPCLGCRRPLCVPRASHFLKSNGVGVNSRASDVYGIGFTVSKGPA